MMTMLFMTITEILKFFLFSIAFIFSMKEDCCLLKERKVSVKTGQWLSVCQSKFSSVASGISVTE